MSVESSYYVDLLQPSLQSPAIDLPQAGSAVRPTPFQQFPRSGTALTSSALTCCYSCNGSNLTDPSHSLEDQERVDPVVNPSLSDLPTSVSKSSMPLGLKGDFNRDGKVDLLWRDNITGRNVIWLMDGATVTASVDIAPLIGSGWRIQGTDDFNGDGQTDLLWRDQESGFNAVWLMNGTATISAIAVGATVPGNWRIQGTGDFNTDGQTDIVWRDYTSGINAVWLLNGTTYQSVALLPSLVGTNLKIHGVADFNQDGQDDLLWRNSLTGENFVWCMNGTAVASIGWLPSAATNWELQGTRDFDGDGNPDLLWQEQTTGALGVWAMQGLTYDRALAIVAGACTPDLVANGSLVLPGSLVLQDLSTPSSLVTISQLSFSQQEGASGSFQIQLTQAPTANVTLTFNTGNFLVVDADGNVANGTQNTITFTPTDWNQVRTVRFIAEVDDSSAPRQTGNTIGYSLTGGLLGTGVYDLGAISNTYAPDPTRFNIDLDFRNDTSGFWNATRRAIAQKAANDWAALITNEWTDFQLNASGSTAIARMDGTGPRTYTFDTKRIVDDLVIFVQDLQISSDDAGYGIADYQFGGWQPNAFPGVTDPMTRVGQVAINTSAFTDESETGLQYIYQFMLHEIGHVLGLVGLNWLSYNRIDRTNGIFLGWDGQGGYSRVANGGNYVTLTSDFQHPTTSVQSILSYGWIYSLETLSPIDRALLADSGYTVVGINDTPVTSSTADASGTSVPAGLTV